MKNLLLIIIFLIISCNGKVNTPSDFQDISIEWTGAVDKPIYKIVICTDCLAYKSVELCRINVSDKTMSKIMETGFKDHQLIINEKNREEGIKKMNHVYELLKDEADSNESLDIIKVFIKRIS